VFRESLSEVAEVLAAVVVAIQVARNGGDAAFPIEEARVRQPEPNPTGSVPATEW
jgi:hypothetical protein